MASMTDDLPEIESGALAPLTGPQAASAEIPGLDDLEGFRAPDLEGSGGGADDVVMLGEDGAPIDHGEAVEQMTKDAFWSVFRHGFGLPGLFSAPWKPLAVQPEEEEIARAASDAIYELLEIYWPGALMPQGDTFARLAAAAPFIMAKVLVVREILHQRRADRLAPAPANQNTAPGEVLAS